MGLTAFQRRNRRLAAGALAVVIAAAGALGLSGVLTGSRADDAPASAIPDRVPAGADTLVVAPFSAHWWEKVTPMDEPSKRLDELEPAEADLSIENIGYSRSQAPQDSALPFSLPLRLFYLESPTNEAAEAVAEWLRYEHAAENRSVFVDGTVVVVGSAGMAGYEQPQEPVSALDSYDQDVRDGEASMWMNTGREAASLTGDPDGAEAAAFMGLLENGFGFTAGTKWMGTSADGSAWAGRFAEGGVDPEKISFEQAVASLTATEEVLAAVDGPTGKAEVVSPGVGAVLDSASFVAGTKHMGELIDVKGAASVTEPLITVTNDVTGWNAAVTGILTSQEKIADRHVSANAKEMVVSFTYEK